jgi:hypothetical protein
MANWIKKKHSFCLETISFDEQKLKRMLTEWQKIFASYTSKD